MANFEIKHCKELRTLLVVILLYSMPEEEKRLRLLLMSEWEDAEKDVWVPSNQVEQIQDEAKKYLVGQYKLCYILGKGKSFVSVFVPNDLGLGIRVLDQERASYGLSIKANLFSRQKQYLAENLATVRGGIT